MTGPVVLYIAGYGRSGSTLLDMLLSRMPGVEGLGELAFLPYWLAADEAPACSCGASPALCPYWRPVIESMESVVQRLGGAARLVREVRRSEGLREMWIGDEAAACGTYAEFQRELWTSILASVPKAQVIVDSSKTARMACARPLTLANLLNLDVRVVHLVRDGRAVLYSVLRGTQRGLEAGKRIVPRFAVLRTIAGYTLSHLAALRIAHVLGPDRVIRVDYEHLVLDPDSTLQRIASFAGVPYDPDWRAVRPHAHRLGGNRVRSAPDVTVKGDDAWRTGLGLGSRLAWRFLGAPIRAALRTASALRTLKGERTRA